MDADDTTLTSAVKYDTDSEHEGKTNNNAGTWIWIATTPRHYAINSMTPGEFLTVGLVAAYRTGKAAANN